VTGFDVGSGYLALHGPRPDWVLDGNTSPRRAPESDTQIGFGMDRHTGSSGIPAKNGGTKDASSLPMRWELRWREMILAGGALAATACTGSTADTDAGAAFNGYTPCCNGGGDPCCYLTCTDGPIPSSYNACEESWGLCESMNGSGYVSDGSFTCNAPIVPVGPSPSEAGAKDGGAPDAGPADAAEDVHVMTPCCNANPDPCCGLIDCSESLDAAIYVTCEHKRTQCEAMDGFYDYQPDGSIGCAPVR
jgi:hypothetical protein